VHLRQGDVEACVDEGVARLVSLLWAAGCRTVHSCQGHIATHQLGHTRAYVMFADAEGFERFYRDLLQGCFELDEGRLLNLLYRAHAHSGKPAAEQEWDVLVSPEVLWGKESSARPRLRYTVRIPRRGLPTVVRLLRMMSDRTAVGSRESA
jgi:hypothetical protein